MQKKSVAASKIWEAPSLHEMRGECDLCARDCFPDAEICVSLACGYRHCTSVIYHQACLEKYLKKAGLEGNRKTGFPCPRGRGKCTKFEEPCRGKIERSHPIINKNPAKQAKKAVPAEVIKAFGKPQPGAKPQPEPAKKPDKKRPALVMAPRVPNTMPGPSTPGVQPSAWHPSHGTRICPAPRTPVPEDDASVYSEHTDHSAEHQDTQQDTGSGLIPGMDLLLTKAQKKNLARRAKKQAAQDSQEAQDSKAPQDSTPARRGTDDDRSQLGFGALSSMSSGESAADAAEWPGGDAADASDAPKEANPLAGTGSWVTDPDAYSRLIASMGGAISEEEEQEQQDEALPEELAVVAAAGGGGARQQPAAVEQQAAAVEPDAAAIQRENEAMEAAIKASLADASAQAAADAAAEEAAIKMYEQQALQRQQQQQQQVAMQAHYAVPIPVPVPQPVAAVVPNVPVPTPLPVLPAHAANGYAANGYAANGYAATGYAATGYGFAGKQPLYQAPAVGYGYGNGANGYGGVEEQQEGEGSDGEDFDSLLALCGVGA